MTTSSREQDDRDHDRATTSIENSQTVETTIITTVRRGERDRCEHGDGPLGVDAGSLHQVAVGATGVPAQRLSHEATDDLVRVRLGDVPHHDAGVGAPDHDADGADDADPDDHPDAR